MQSYTKFAIFYVILHVIIMINSIRESIDQEMSCFEHMRQELLTSSNPLLGAALAHVASRKGKMMRPMLVFLMNQHADSIEIQHAALALEMLHTASLVHDDVVDKSDERRGQKSINTLFTNSIAVLVGDYILSTALCESARTRSVDFVESIAQLGRDLSDGELLQLHNLDENEITEQQYYEVIKRKTASLFATCAAAPFIIKGEDSKSAYSLGEKIGMIFQIKDDIFDLEGADVGKPTGNDLLEGKLTLPVIHAVHCNPSLLPIAHRVRIGDATKDEIKILADEARSTGIAYAYEVMQNIATEAKVLVDKIAKNHQYTLYKYINYVAERKI